MSELIVNSAKGYVLGLVARKCENGCSGDLLYKTQDYWMVLDCSIATLLRGNLKILFPEKGVVKGEGFYPNLCSSIFLLYALTKRFASLLCITLLL